MRTIEYKILDCEFNAPEAMKEYEFEKAINELAKDRWEPLLSQSKFRVIMARTIKDEKDAVARQNQSLYA